MRLRDLELKDAPLMLEWMHDESVVEKLRGRFAVKTIEDCEDFIKAAVNKEHDIHLAIVSDEDEYMGTVSLKHMDKTLGTAEFAISTRQVSMGKGYASQAMKRILDMGIKDFGLKNIFWCVSKENKRAIRFYDKNGYTRTSDIPKHILDAYTCDQLDTFIWYIYR